MKAVYADLRARYLKLARRERGLALAAALILCAGLGEVFFIEPVVRQRATMLRQIEAQKSESESLRQRLGGSLPDATAAMHAQLATLKAQVRSTDAEFRALQSGLVQPQHMGALLQSLLTEHRSLQLLGLRSLPVSGLNEPLASLARKAPPSGDRAVAAAAANVPASAPVASDEAWLYRHAVEIRVQGSYADMLAYLQELESLPRRVYWGDLEIDARNYPTNVMTVTIFTVSLEKSWWVL